MPLTLIATDPDFQLDTRFVRCRDRRVAPTWTGSVIEQGFMGRAQEVKLVLPLQ